MFYWLTGIALLLAAIVLIQSMRAERNAHRHKLEAIRKQIEENEKKKLREKLEGNRETLKKEKDQAKESTPS